MCRPAVLAVMALLLVPAASFGGPRTPSSELTLGSTAFAKQANADGIGQVRPATVDYGSFPVYADLRWTGWGDAVAQAAGHDVPDGPGGTSPTPVELRAYDIGGCDGSGAYRRLERRYHLQQGWTAWQKWEPGGGSGSDGGSLCLQRGNVFPGCPNDLRVGADVVVRSETCFKEGPGGFKTTGAVRFNGLDLKPTGGTVAPEITVNPNAKTLDVKGDATLYVGTIPLHVYRNATLDLGDKIELLADTGDAKLFGLGLAGPVEVAFLPDEAAMLTVTVSFDLAGDAVEGGVVLDTSNSAGLSVAGVTFHVTADPVDPRFKPGQTCNVEKPAPSGFDCDFDPAVKRAGGRLVATGNHEVKLGWLPIEDFKLSYDAHGSEGRPEWSGSAKVELGRFFPGTPHSRELPAFGLGVDFLTDPTQFKSFDGEVDNFSLLGLFDVGALKVHLQIQRPVEVSGSVEDITIGPDIAGRKPAKLKSAGFSYKQGEKNGFELGASGEIELFGDLTIGGHFDYDGRDGGEKLTLGGSLGRDWGPVHLEGSIDGGASFDPFQFQVHGEGEITIWGQGVHASLLASNAGFGACGTLDILFFHGEVGFTHQWNGDTQFFTCDFSSLETVTGRRRQAAQGNANVPLRVAPGTPRVEFAAVGGAEPPEVDLIDPAGNRISGPSAIDSMQFQPHVLELAESSARTTYLVVQQPAAGVWHVVPAAGAPAPIAISRAAAAVPLALHMRVTGTGRKRTLRWRYRGQPGRFVTFVEEGPFTAQTLRARVPANGSLTFRPGAGPGGRRRIVALVGQDGLVRRRVVAARFSAPTTRLAQPASAGYVVHGRVLRVHWRSVGGADGYVVVVTLRRGNPLRVPVARRSRLGLRLALGERIRHVGVAAEIQGAIGPQRRARRG